jgi:hypothetical protein
MGVPYSLDLRERIVAAVASGMSRRGAAKLYQVSYSAVINWVARSLQTGSPCEGVPSTNGRNRRKRLSFLAPKRVISTTVSAPANTASRDKSNTSSSGYITLLAALTPVRQIFKIPKKYNSLANRTLSRRKRFHDIRPQANRRARTNSDF